MTTPLPNNGKAEVSVNFPKAKGQSAPTPGPVAWSVSDPTLATVQEVSDDHTSVRVTALGREGVFRVAVDSGDFHGETEDFEIVDTADATKTVRLTIDPRSK